MAAHVSPRKPVSHTRRRSPRPPEYVRVASRQYALGYPIIAAFVGGVIGQVVGEVTGLGTFIAGVGFTVGIVDAVWSAFRIQ